MFVTNRVEIKPEVMMGKPVIRGTRITVELVLRRMSEGATVESLLDSYPHLTREDILGALDYACSPVQIPGTYEIFDGRKVTRSP